MPRKKDLITPFTYTIDPDPISPDFWGYRIYSDDGTAPIRGWRRGTLPQVREYVNDVILKATIRLKTNASLNNHSFNLVREGRKTIELKEALRDAQ